MNKKHFIASVIVAAWSLAAGHLANAALLAYEPFTNAPGTAIIGSGAGMGFSGAWQDYQTSLGTATNTSYGLGYTDASGNSLTTTGGAGFFQGLTTASTAMAPIRLFNFSRGTNGIDGTTTWISFIIVRQGPTGSLAGNPYGRGANMAHDIHVDNTTGLQKLAIGNSSGVATNTIGLIPAGASGNLKSSSVAFGNFTNFVVVRLEHVLNGSDNAHLFINPDLSVEPSTNSANANSLGVFDFSFNRVRAFAGGNSSAAQPYVEMVIDEYRVGETYADVAPYGAPATPASLVITNTALDAGSLVLSGTGGSNSGAYLVLASTDVTLPLTNWPAVATNNFDAAGNFIFTNPIPPGSPGRFYRLQVGSQSSSNPPVAPVIITQPTNQSALAGQNVTFMITATGTAPLRYQWYFNTNTPLANATNTSLTIANVQTNNAGTYSVIVTNIAGSTNSLFASLTVTNPPGAPTINTPPANQTVTEGSNATFTVTATGTAPLAYQWFYNTNTPLPNANNTSLVISNAQSADAGTYSVRVTNSIGAVTSVFATLTVNAFLQAGAFFVATNGNDSNPGTLASPFRTISRGLGSILNGGVVYLRGGTYPSTTTLSLSRTTASATNMIRLWAYPGEKPVIDNTGMATGTRGINISGRYYYFKGIEQMKAGDNGFYISGSSNILENCVVHENGDTGIHITGGSTGTTFPSYNLITNCDSYLNYDPPIGGNADGFSAKWNLGAGNVFSGCRAWWNSDDGWDLWMGTSSILIDNCWAFWSGTNYWSDPLFNGNGQGFKLGGNYVGAPHRLMRSLAFVNESNGVDQNNNLDSQTVDNNTAWGNKARNFNLNHGTNSNPHVVRNNVSFGAASGDSFRSGTLFTNNSWQVVTSPAASATDVLSVATTGVTGPRQADGSLPVLPFLRPVVGGRLIDKGVNVGLPFSGAAPDLGAFESP